MAGEKEGLIDKKPFPTDRPLLHWKVPCPPLEMHGRRWVLALALWLWQMKNLPPKTHIHEDWARGGDSPPLVVAHPLPWTRWFVRLRLIASRAAPLH